MGTTLAQPATTLLAQSPTGRESLESLYAFMAESVKIGHRLDRGILHLEYDAATHPRWPKPHHVAFAVSGEARGQHSRHDVTPLEASLWLWERAHAARTLVMARPATQPEAVHELTERLFTPYEMDGGRVHLAGCQLVDVPFLRISTLAADDPSQVEHRLTTIEGNEVPEELREKLDLANLVPQHGPSAIATEPPLAQAVAQLLQSAAPEGVVAVTVVVAKRAEGKLQFQFGAKSITIDFDDWAATLEAPPYCCRLTGRSTYHLATTDDGRIAAAEGIASCEVSGKRLLASELVTCIATGKRVDPTLTLKCPVSGEPALASEFATCSLCRQEVSQAVLDATLCRACRHLEKAARDDAAVADLLARAPKLKRFRQIRTASTNEVTIVEGVGLWKHLLVVVGQADGQVRQVATRTPATTWTHLPEERWAAELGG